MHSIANFPAIAPFSFSSDTITDYSIFLTCHLGWTGKDTVNHLRIRQQLMLFSLSIYQSSYKITVNLICWNCRHDLVTDPWIEQYPVFRVFNLNCFIQAIHPRTWTWTCSVIPVFLVLFLSVWRYTTKHVPRQFLYVKESLPLHCLIGILLIAQEVKKINYKVQFL